MDVRARKLSSWVLFLVVAGLVACEGVEGPTGPVGPEGMPGSDGPPGADGEDGEDGANGANGANGADGQDGDDGHGALVSVTPEPGGDNCAVGGQRVDTGRDLDDDGTLDPEEVEGTAYICDGSAGSLVVVGVEPNGDNCPFGGHRVDSGQDGDGDGTLADNEIDSTVYICDDCEGAEECDPFVPVAQSAETEDCLTCHVPFTPGVVGQWETSRHYGAQVGCYECHQADANDVDAMDHNGFTIAILVTPVDCANCHPDEETEFTASHHALGGQILDSLDNRLAEVIEGDLTLDGESPVAAMGCADCHGSRVQVNDDGTLSEGGYPNAGIGRINPDGSLGACSACHGRHDFSVAAARRPDSCGRCHLGPDHPHIEIYEESAHGVAFANAEDEMALDAESWIAGVDYTAAPTCATCHMGATPNQAPTHDVGSRLSWNLRAAVSTHVADWETKRGDMMDVCGSCHAGNLIDNHYLRLDEGVDLYNSKFAQPATEIYDAIRAQGLITLATFDDELEWTYYYLWHHEGRRARAGMAMVGADFAQWHGFFEVADRFYVEFVPQARELLAHAMDPAAPDYDPAHDAAAQVIETQLHDILCRPEHRWFGEQGCP